MYYQNYEDYMRSVLGYPIDNSNIYSYDNYYEEAENLYPEIYRRINPIVCKECDMYTGSITREALEDMVDRIYSNIEMNNDIMVNINIDNRSMQDKNRVNTKEIDNRNNNFKGNEIQSNREVRVVEAENRQRRPNNPLLRDLIRILILNRLFKRPQRPPRPPFPGPGRPPIRPPFPGSMSPYL